MPCLNLSSNEAQAVEMACGGHLCVSGSSATKAVNHATIVLFPILRRLRAFFQHLAVPDGAFAGVSGEFEILSQLQGIDRTSVLAQPAKHTAAEVVGEVSQFLATGGFVSF